MVTGCQAGNLSPLMILKLQKGHPLQIRRLKVFGRLETPVGRHPADLSRAV